ncbi:hypothetical protein EG028_25270 [Chitinophaga barathri]|uniref:Uncharacterized protein n=1 Tax=Chitinophaga barathri TaxID=1647451 RepID=A0A3N4M626_9BACT|nr:hypothetical protein EG028_25270 [Chitinophaga barathri]
MHKAFPAYTKVIVKAVLIPHAKHREIQADVIGTHPAIVVATVKEQGEVTNVVYRCFSHAHSVL